MNIIHLINKFSSQEVCIEYLEKARFGDKPFCTYCGSNKVSKHKEKNQQARLQCSSCKKSFSVTVGTIFHSSKKPIQQWFLVMALMLNAKKGLSAYQIARDLGIRRATVWSMMHRIRKAMQTDQAELLSGIVEMDETYIGGKPKKKNNKDDEDDNNPRGRGTKKECVVGMIEIQGKVKASKADSIKGKDLKELVRKNVNTDNALLITDEYRGYSRMQSVINHLQVNHNKNYVSSKGIHTNNIESFWAILKRGIIGQFHKVSAKYLDNYIDEFCWRFNSRKSEDSFSDLVKLMLG